VAKKKNPHAVALGRLGGKVKVKKGLAMLPKAQRSELARKAVTARWAKAKGKSAKTP
jgi:hypothetical protein